jgi:hypothetical protein
MAATLDDQLSYNADVHQSRVDPSDYGSLRAFLWESITLMEKNKKRMTHK